MFCTFYGRCSTTSTQQTDALDNQEEEWKQYFKDNGLEMNPECGVFYTREGKYTSTNGYYIDEGISGYKTMKYRKAFLRMIEDAKMKKFNKIYTRSISRFGRNVKEILQTIEVLRKYNVGVYFDDVKIDTLDQNDNFKLLIFAGLAEEESRLKSSSIQKGKLIAADKKGVWAGREPYGYNIANAELDPNMRGKLVINKQEAEVVKLIFNLYLVEGWGLNKIAKHLNTDENKGKYIRKRGAKKWDQSIIGKMLSNPIYNGEVIQHRTFVSDPQQNIVKKVPESEQVKYTDESLRIIDKETFERVQTEKEERYKMLGHFKYEEKDFKDEVTGETIVKKVRTGIARTKERYSGAYIFSNLLRCGNCGGTLRYKKQKSTSGRIHHYWLCNNNDKLGACKYRNLQRQDELLEWVKGEIQEFRTNKKSLENSMKMLLENEYDTDEAISRINELGIKIEEKENERELNFNLLAKKSIQEDEYVKRNKKIEDELMEMTRERDKLRHIDREVERLHKKFNEFVEGLEQLDLDNLTNQILRKLFNKITITTSDIYQNVFHEIEWNFMDTTMSKILSDSINKELENYGYAYDIEDDILVAAGVKLSIKEFLE